MGKVAERIRKKGKLEVKVSVIMLLIFLAVMISTTITIVLDSFDEALDEKKDDLKFVAEIADFSLSRYNAGDYDGLSAEEQQELYAQLTNYGAFIDGWLANGADEYYYRAHGKLIDLKNSLSYTYSEIFIYKAGRNENGELINDMTVVFQSPTDGKVEYSLGDHFGASQAFETVKKVYETGEAQVYDGIGNDSHGNVVICYAPVKYSDGTVCAVTGVEASATRILLDVIDDNRALILDTAINFIVFAAVIFIFIKFRVVKPVKIVSRHMNKFVANEGSFAFKPITEIHTKDEIEQIADDFNSLAQRTIDYTKDLEQKTVEQARLRGDLNVANQIRIVISSEPTYPPFPERSDFDLCSSLNYTMYNRCSFCNYFFSAPDHLFIVAGEPLGDSFASMLFTVLAVSYIKSFAKLGFEPYKIALETNNELCSIEKTDAGLTVGIIIIDIDLKSGVMKYINAGMPPMIIKDPGENYALDKPDKPFSLGQMRGVSFEQKSLQLYQGSTIMLTSFGVTGMCDPKGTKYGFDRLTNVMNRISGSVYDLDKTIDLLEKDIDDFRDGSSATRDTMICGFRYFG